jgi:hypothetical protein
MGLITAAKLLLKGKSMGAISKVAPFSKIGAKSVESWKSAAAKAKLNAAKFNLKETFKKSDEVLGKLKETVKKGFK